MVYTGLKNDGSNKEQISQENWHDINICNEWIYYTDPQTKNSIYKIRIDGTGKIQIYDKPSINLNVYGDWIYFRNDESIRSKSEYCRNLCKIKTDGTCFTKVSDSELYDYNGNCSCIGIVGNLAFFNCTSNCAYICKIDTDGLNDITIVDDRVGSTSRRFDLKGEWIYFYKEGVGNFKKKINGLNETAVQDGEIWTEGDWVYFNKSDKFYKTNFNGSSLTDIISKPVNVICISDSWIFYTDNNNQLLKIDTDGRNETLLHSNISTYLYYDKENKNIYYTATDGIYKAEINKTIPTKISDTKYISIGLKYYVINNDWIYGIKFENEGMYGKAYKVRLDGSGLTKITDDYIQLDFLYVKDEWIYYVNESDGNKLYKVKTDGTSKTKLSDKKVYSFSILDNTIYYNYMYDDGLNVLNIDGTNQHIVNYD